MKRYIALALAASSLMSLLGCRKREVHPPVTSTPTEHVTEHLTVPTTEETVPAPENTVPVIETAAPTEPAVIPEPEDDELVKIVDHIPGICQELPYATADNFTGRCIYDFTDAYLRYGTVKKLRSVWEELSRQGLSLKIWDGFRPVSAQFKLWEICPDPTFVANPNKGYSSHSRGNTVDLTLVDTEGNELEMPTGFDDFSEKANRDYSDCTPAAAANAQLLQNTMEKYGFSGYFGEWWHFSDEESYPVEEAFDPVDTAWYYADCSEFISLRTQPDTSAEVITRILVNEQFLLLELHGDFALVEYQGLQGYVLRSYIRRVG